MEIASWASILSHINSVTMQYHQNYLFCWCKQLWCQNKQHCKRVNSQTVRRSKYLLCEHSGLCVRCSLISLFVRIKQRRRAGLITTEVIMSYKVPADVLFGNMLCPFAVSVVCRRFVFIARLVNSSCRKQIADRWLVRMKCVEGAAVMIGYRVWSVV